jgi:uncharacterized cupredoxin-like copper-binding protein
MNWLLRTAAVPAVVAGSLVLAGCGGGGSKTTAEPSTTSASVKTIVVEETEFKMVPSLSRVKLGTYKFEGVNKGTIPHVLELEGPGLENETGTIAPGETATIELVLRTPGKYELYCPLDDHKQKGMVVEFTVER